jgi:hypothetical protein
MIQARSATNLSSVRRLTFEAYRRAEAMGLVDPAPPTEEFDITGVKKVLQGVRDAGIARSPMIELESLELGSVVMGGAEAPESGDLAELMKMVIAALEASPAPSSEWRSVSRVFDAESLAPLLGISVSSLRRYQAGTRATPDEVAARLHFLALVISDLAGAYNEIGVRRWFHRERSLLDGKTPGMLLSGEWNPEDEGAQRVRDLARSLVMLSST